VICFSLKCFVGSIRSFQLIVFTESGFGGPIIKAPFLLALHISPQDASQTMQAMLAVATSASLLQYAFLHMLPPLESMALFATHAFIGSFIGTNSCISSQLSYLPNF
jgi:uncharacterized membrane protein YfcA